MKRILLAVFLFVNFVAFGQTKPPYVILVSFDGFRSDYVERFGLPNFKKFIANGVAAEGLIPSFPSKTFPNHYTIVTGLYPGNHGLVDNQFFDRSRKISYSMSRREVVTDPYFYGGVPLWQLCRQHGIRSASYFWVGSELREEQLRPDYYYPYDMSVPFSLRVDQVLQWLALPESERPHFITLYFSSPDHESHRYGPLANETRHTVMAMDSLLGGLIERVEKTDLPVNVILVSDHGMSELYHKLETFIFVDELVPPNHSSIKVANGGTQAHIYTRDKEQCDSLFSALQPHAKTFSIIRHKDFPKRWNYDHDRAGDILILANPGYYLMTGTREKVLGNQPIGTTFGVHGYDPSLVSEMKGIFYAKGPNIKAGSKLPAFENIHVYPLIATILGLKTPRIDGRAEVLKVIYKK